jgi:hypothetical protein
VGGASVVDLQDARQLREDLAVNHLFRDQREVARAPARPIRNLGFSADDRTGGKPRGPSISACRAACTRPLSCCRRNADSPPAPGSPARPPNC